MKSALKLLRHQINLNQKILCDEKKREFNQQLWEIMEARKVFIKELKEALQVLKLEQECRNTLRIVNQPKPKGWKLSNFLIKRAFQTAGPRKTRKPNLPRA
jgi:hypothetical protein